MNFTQLLFKAQEVETVLMTKRSLSYVSLQPRRDGRAVTPELGQPSQTDLTMEFWRNPIWCNRENGR